MNEDFIFRVGADVSGFTKSISDVERELKKVQTELKTKTGAAIVETNKYISDLQSSLVNLRSQGLSQLPKAVNDGAASLNALGQVARDAPFGFIAIQNNLPILFDQLGNLSKQSGGATNALKAIGASLVGPAGVTFAIGAAISAITVLVQKYGSVGAALDAIISKQSVYSEEILEASKSYEKFNKEKRDSIEISSQEVASLDGTVSRVKSLASIVTDQTRSYNERNAALNDLKSISKEYFGNLDLEKTKLSDLTIAIDSYINSIKQAAITKGFEGAIGETSVELAKQIKLLDQLKQELEAAKAAPVKFIGKADQVDTRDVDAATARFNAQNKVVQSLRGDISLYNNEIDKSIKLQNQIQAPIDAANKALEDQKKAAETAKKAAAEAKRLSEERARNAEKERTDALRVVQDRIKRQDFLNKQDLKNLRTATDERRKIERESGIVTPTTLPTVPPSIPINAQKIAEDARLATLALEGMKEAANMSAAFNLINSTFFSPIEDLFSNFLQTGKFAFKEFAQAILKAISQIVAKVIATGIITLLASLFIPGFGAAGGGIGKSILSGITGALGFGGGGFGGGGRVAAPNFGGVSGGGMQMAGAVNLTLRGSDLVGSINRTNATISRVG
jgi:hypothetical protein